MKITSADRRTAATEQFEMGRAAVSAVFDATDELRATLADVSLSSTGADPLRAALEVEDALPRLRGAVSGVRLAAAAAAVYTSKAAVAGHADTKPALLFPRADAPFARPASTARADGSGLRSVVGAASDVNATGVASHGHVDNV